MSHTDQDIMIPALTVDQILALDENQLSLPLDYPAGNIDFTFDPNMSNAGGDFTISTLDAVDLSGNIDWSTLGSNISLGPIWSDNINPMTVNNSGRIQIQGEDADIEINGESVVGMLKEIRDRLNIIQVSETMEAEWDELRALREQYESKLAECREKSRAWTALGAQETKKDIK